MPSTWPDAAEVHRLRAVYAASGPGPTWTAWGYVFSAQERERQALRLLGRHGFLPLERCAILDLGCGTGSWIRQLVRWGALPERVTGVDLLPEAVREARRRVPAGVHLEVANAARLGLAPASFDVVVQSTVFTSVPEAATRRAIAAEVLRVLRPGGMVLWFDFYRGSPRNPHVRRVTRAEIRALFPGCRMELRRTTLAPPLMRHLAPRSWLLTYLLGRVPWLCTHYIGAIRPRAGAGLPEPVTGPAARPAPAVGRRRPDRGR